MKRLITVALFFLGLTTQAQSPEAIKLQQQIRQHPQEDTFRVNRLNDLAVRTSLSLAARDSAASEALAISEKINYRNGKINALSTLSYIKSAQGDNYNALTLLQEAYTLLKSGNDKIKIVKILLDINYIKQLTDEGKTAIDDLMLAETLAKDIPEKKYLAQCQKAIGAYYYNIESNYPFSMEWLLKAMKTAEEADCALCLGSIWTSLGNLYSILGDQEKALGYFQKVSDADKINGDSSSSYLLNSIGERYRLMGKYPESLVTYKEAISIEEDPYNIELYESNLADVYVRMDSLPQAFHYAFKALEAAEKLQDVTGIAWIDGILSRAYLKKNMLDSALFFATNGLRIATESGALEFMRDNTEALAKAYLQKEDFENAYKYNSLFYTYRDSMLNENVTNQAHLLQFNYNKEKTQAQIAMLNQQKKDQKTFLIMALVFLGLIILTAIFLYRNNRHKQRANMLLQRQKKEIDTKASELAVQKEHLEQSYNNVELLGEIGRKITSSLSVEKIISTVYNTVNKLMDAAIFGVGIYNDRSKTIDFPATYENGQALSPYSNSIEDKNRFAAVCFTQTKEIVMSNLNEEYKQFVQIVVTPYEGGQPHSIIFLPLMIKDKRLGVITVQSFKKNAYSDYHLYMLRNIAIYTAIALENAESFNTLNKTISSLKSTQAQLIQSEKMASLGELTAGIAHEIQNPLNFVNNFSEVSYELFDEMKDGLSKGDVVAAKAIADDIQLNLQKIVHHGKRADVIVKGMLQHSRKSSGQKEPTDINELVDEYLRLSYHGLRAKDKTFNATMKTNFDKSVVKINLIPQDMGRVLLNLFNNAFYAITEKKKAGLKDYEPTLFVTTKMLGERIEIIVKDNGNGIPQNILDKIFQPFFTTKHTGEGTGLGLSLSYDIIRVHEGTLNVETKEGEFTAFIINLPMKGTE